MTERERLVELLKNANATYKDDMPCTQEEFTADFLSCSGVIVLPCKVGDKVYTVLDVEHDIGEFEIYSLHYIITDHRIIRYIAECHSHDDVDEIWFYDDEIGETVFLTSEEAEKALEEMEK